jgi:hypothetical protein
VRTVESETERNEKENTKMKCPLCHGTFTDPGRSKGGKASKRKITPEQQKVMQWARKKKINPQRN